MTIEIHELDITDGLNKTLYDELKAENEKLKKQLDIAVKGLWFIYYQSDVKDMYDCAEGTLKQLGELEK